MNKLLNKAIRPLAALTAVGALAAVAAFALLAMPGSQPAEAAQQVVAGEATTPSEVAVTAIANRVTLAVTNADLDDADTLFFDIPGYSPLGVRTWNHDGDDGTTDEVPDTARTCVVAVMVGDDNRVGADTVNSLSIPNGLFVCQTKPDNSGIHGWASVAGLGTDVTTYSVVVTDLRRLNAVSSTVRLTLRENSDSDSAGANLGEIDYNNIRPGADHANLVGIGYNAGTEPVETNPGIAFELPGNGSDSLDINSTTASASIQIQAKIANVPEGLESGSSVVLYLEDDYVVPDTISKDHVWFTISGDTNTGAPNQARRGRHYPTDPVEVETDDYYGGDDDTHIQVYIPDLYEGDVVGTSEGFQIPVAGQSVTLTIHKNAGIKNPSEVGMHSVGYSVLTPDESDVPDPKVQLPIQNTYPKISLSDDDDARGKEVTVTGSGFKNGVSATLRMKHYPTAGRYQEANGAVMLDGNGDAIVQAGDPRQAVADQAAVDANREEARRNNALGSFTLAVGDVMTQAETCIDIVTNGNELSSGNNVVGSDDRVQITFTVSNPPFLPGNQNLLCMVDGKRNASRGDVEHFKLDPSIRVVPETVNAGDQVTVFAEDYPTGAGFDWLEVFGTRVTPSSSTGIGTNGKGNVQFNMPGDRKGTIEVKASWGGDPEDTTISVEPSQLSASKTEVRANESIIIRGSGFSKASGNDNDLKTAKLGEAGLVLVSDAGNLQGVEVSNSGQFSATFAVWSNESNNPALQPGNHKIVIEDMDGFTGQVEITIVEPTISVTPDVAGPRDYVVISGADWPVENDDGGNVEDVKITVSGGGIDPDEMNETADANGNWSLRYRVPGDVSIPGTLNVKAAYGESEDIVEIEQFSVPQANLQISPATVVPGGDLTLSASGFSLYESQIDVKIGNVDVAVPTGTSTDREGALEDLTVKVPSLDAATYTVQLKVGGDNGTVAIGEVVILADEEGGEAELPGALTPLGDNLVRVFHFNNASKTWSFYDPRPQFAELNTLSALAAGEPYWILVDESQSVTLNAKAHEMTCQGGDCWNSLVW